MSRLLNGKRILIVDDEPDVLETLKDFLETCDLMMASSFSEAKDRVESEYFDIAILDIMGVRRSYLERVAMGPYIRERD